MSVKPIQKRCSTCIQKDAQHVRKDAQPMSKEATQLKWDTV